jgi:hypothetical protein
MCLRCERLASHEDLPLWLAEQRKNNTWKATAGLHYWHPKKRFRVIAYRNNDKVYFGRACEKCGGNTKNYLKTVCEKRKCGGLGDRSKMCTHVDMRPSGALVHCSRIAHHVVDDDRLCRPHFCMRRPHVACIRCGRRPFTKHLDSGLCFSCQRTICGRHDRRSSSRDIEIVAPSK